MLPPAVDAAGASGHRLRLALVLGGTYMLLVIGAAIWVSGPVVLFLIPLMGLPWAAMLGISAWLVRPASLALVAAVLASSAAVLPAFLPVAFGVGDPRDAALEFMFFAWIPFVVFAIAAFELLAESRRPAPGDPAVAGG